MGENVLKEEAVKKIFVEKGGRVKSTELIAEFKHLWTDSESKGISQKTAKLLLAVLVQLFCSKCAKRVQTNCKYIGESQQKRRNRSKSAMFWLNLIIFKISRMIRYLC